MLFNSPVFLLVFLPLTLIAFYRAQIHGPRRTNLVLLAASIVFYGWWNPANLPLIAASILGNYWLGLRLAASGSGRLLAAGVAFNLALIGFFKYADFFVANVNALTGAQIALLGIVLPLGISFFTFQQIGYLVECRRHRTPDRDPVSYALFVLFFPQLIAGPIVQHKDLAPQFRQSHHAVGPEMFAQGLFLLMVGLAKKVVVADNLAPWADPAFANPADLHLLDAWTAVLAYTLQIYFDFSAYSEMAMGLGYLFGMRIPQNFDAPYKSASITEFWRRWHMTLGQFLREYLYIPLGGNRRGLPRTVAALVVTMFLGGLWHGAAWTFVLWGLLHGAFLIAHRLWSLLDRPLPRPLAIAVTFLCVVFAWVLFRANSLQDALTIWSAMLGLNGQAVPQSLAGMLSALPSVQFRFSPYFEGIEPFIVAGVTIFALQARTVHELWQARVQPNLRWAGAMGGLAVVTMFSLSRESSFLYWSF